MTVRGLRTHRQAPRMPHTAV